ncbi:MAG: hypothetical protein KKE02_09155 [Alphaproteobacteria bacterium]|nr:hypothetical protein [Alphaproteobacteria bacterium]MBU1514130.1 hypothetical protein [Alphaproteobacteria bacterium]MBU2096221.1 hypothetical protein [Alphaproteobacteria bacterium]MBU2151175.1 hypothetical protein [Alphaproteobacteria bacterium]MBU2307166.1 hypothetical protein [Alphaproteobacteria bacterium]
MRVAAVGTSGSGKTTFAGRLAAAMGVRHVELDAVTWQAGWVALHETDPAEFVRRAGEALAGEDWVACGNYITSRPTLLARATDLVWLDYPRPLVMARVIRRSFVRAAGQEELWPGTGNREAFADWFGREHPIRWAWDTYDRRKRQYEALFGMLADGPVRTWRVTRPWEAEALIARLAAEAGA